MAKYPRGTRITFTDTFGRDGEPMTGEEVIRTGIVNGDEVPLEDAEGQWWLVPVWSPPLEGVRSGDHMIMVHSDNIIEVLPAP